MVFRCSELLLGLFKFLEYSEWLAFQVFAAVFSVFIRVFYEVARTLFSGCYGVLSGYRVQQSGYRSKKLILNDKPSKTDYYEL